MTHCENALGHPRDVVLYPPQLKRRRKEERFGAYSEATEPLKSGDQSLPGCIHPPRVP